MPLRWLALAGLFIVIAAMTAGLVRQLGAKQTIQEQKRESAELISYYVVTPDDGPEFELQSTDRLLRTISHVVMPGGRYDPQATVTYGFRLIVKDSAETILWQRDLYTESRQSKDRFKDGVWRDENVFSVRPGTELGDDRILEVRLPDEIPDGAELSVKLLGDRCQESECKALFRAYRQVELAPLFRRVRARALDNDDQRVLTRRLRTPWDRLRYSTRDALLGQQWQRMAAIGEEGVRYHSQRVHYTGFHHEPAEEAERQGVRVDRHRHAAINVEARAPITLAIDASNRDRSDNPGRTASRTPAAGPAAAHGESALTVTTVAANGSTSEQRFPMPASDTEPYSLEVPEGLHSLLWRVDGPGAAFMRVRASRGDWVQFGDLTPIASEAHPTTHQLVVDERRLPVHLLSSAPEDQPISIAIDGLPEADSRIFAIEVRALLDEDGGVVHDVVHDVGDHDGHDGHDGHDTKSETTPRLTYRFTDVDDRTLQRGSAAIAAIPAPFESVRVAPQWLARQARQETRRTREPLQRVAEPVRYRVIAPSSAHRMQLTTNATTVIRVFTYVADEPRYERPYRDHDLAAARWRYAPRERRVWFPVRPENWRELDESGQAATVRAQVRLQPRGQYATSAPRAGEMPAGSPDPSLERTADPSSDPPASIDDRAAVPLEPVLPPRRQRILERVSPARQLETVRDWPPGSYTALTGAAIRVLDRGGARARVRYRVEGTSPAALGSEVIVRVDGRDLVQHVLSATRGMWTLPRIPAGSHDIACVSPVAELRCFIDQPPAPPGWSKVYRIRTVFPLDGRPLRLRVHKTPDRDIVINAVVYAAGSEARAQSRIRVLLDGGRPRRRIGTLLHRVTPARRAFRLPAARFERPPVFLDVAERSPGVARTIAFRLGNDLRPGLHVVELRTAKLSGWIRFFTYDLAAPTAESAWQWRLEPPETSTTDEHREARPWSAAASRAGFELAVWHIAGQRYWAVIELDDRTRGAGAYIVRVDDDPGGLILQAPHVHFDRGTGAIAIELFFTAGLGRALFVNTTHRYWRSGERPATTPDAASARDAGPLDEARKRFPRRHNSPADLCHRADHIFQDATLAAVRALDHAVVVQLHGFADNPDRPDAIVSAGAAHSDRVRSRAASALVAHLATLLDDVRRYPDDIAELGATSNAQGRALEHQPRASFVHLELSATTRRRLGSSSDLRQGLAAALVTMMTELSESAENTR